MAKPTVLIGLGAFWPGHESTGPNLSLKSLCQVLGEDYDFRILARDRPFGSDQPFAPTGEWRDLGYAQARYLPIGPLGARGLAPLLRQTPHDLIVLNGFFDKEFTIPVLMLRRLGLVPRRPVILSPRGEFAGGALALKGARKASYLGLVRTLGLLDSVTIHATNDQEAGDIRRGLPFAWRVGTATNVRGLFDLPPAPEASDDGVLKLAFLGRVTPVKNVDYGLEVLSRVKAPVRWDIYGPISDEAYWARCRQRIEALPAHVEVRHMGEIANDDAPQMLAGYDLMFLPTRGENFGHAIFEALASGTPVAISDQTPWKDLERRKAGWDLPLADPEGFARAIDALAAMAPNERAAWRAGARAFAEQRTRESDALARTRALYASAIARGPA